MPNKILLFYIVIFLPFIKSYHEYSTKNDNLESYPVYKLNTYFYFDPITNKTCNEKNYWTPFDQSSTCYMFVSVTPQDSEKKSTIKLMLSHNIATSTFNEYKTELDKISSSWKRYKGKIDIIDEDTIYGIMKYSKKPTKTKSENPPYKLGYYCSNSDYIINGKKINQQGYWTKTTFNNDSVYAISENGVNFISSKESKLGIRPVIELDKSLFKVDSGVIDISKILKTATRISYNHEQTKYDGLIYKQLQGFTVTKNNLIFISSNNENRAKSLLYSYKLDNLKSLYTKSYDTIGHGNGITYNTKTDKLMVVGPDEYAKIYQLNPKTLMKEKEFPTSQYPKFTSIGYDDKDNLYLGQCGKRIFLSDPQTLKKLHEFGVYLFETAQDIEYYNGYSYFITTDLSAPNKYQIYSFYKKYDNIIYVYDTKLDKNKNPTNNFGRLIYRLKASGFGELEDISFRDGNIYFGFATKNIFVSDYLFLKMHIKTFEKELKKLIK